MSSAFSHTFFEDLPLVGILRGFEQDQVAHIVQACVDGGFKNLEITMNTAGAAAQIALAAKFAGSRMNIGAGTVISRELLDAALAAGAAFIVTPTLNPSVIRECVARGVPIFPGALSPTEVMQAQDLGATMVKIFPADKLGAAYVKSLKANLPSLKLMPTGGVDLTTMRDLVCAGADAFGIGNPLFDRERVSAGDWHWLSERCRLFADAFRAAPLVASGLR